MKQKRLKKPSFFSQVLVLTTRAFDILSNDEKHLIMIAFLPVLSASVIAIIGSEQAFQNYEATQINLFSIVCAAIFIGVFNSIQDICKERNILKREYMTNLRLDSYIVSKLLVQAAICFVQTLIMTVIFFAAFDFPKEGLIFYSSAIDGFITIFFLMLASSMTGLFISAVVKNPDMANLIAPIVILLQIVFSDALTKLEGISGKISLFMLSKWGMMGLSSLSRLGEQKYKVELMFPSLPIEIAKELTFESTGAYLYNVWIVFIAFIAALAILSGIALINVSKDSR